jgi:hypothetical protein
MRISSLFQRASEIILKVREPDDQLPAKRNSLRQVETYEVERHKFDRIEREATGIGIGFTVAAACLPTAITLNVTLKTVAIKDANTAVPIWSLMWACYIVGIAVLIWAWIKRGDLKRDMQDIRDTQVPPVSAKLIPSSPDLTATNDPSAPPAVPHGHEGDEDLNENG